MLDKRRLVAITKCDVMDAELLTEMRAELAASFPGELDVTFISSVSGLGITELKDKLWAALMRENK
jgi:GTP-binding protein